MIMEFIDLHTHSNCSDGTLAPAEIFSLARSIELAAVALTDHDTVAGIPEFMAAAKEHPECEAIPGVELACSFMSKEIHIVGLFINPAGVKLQEFIEDARLERMRRNRDLLVKLSLLGYELDLSMPQFAGLPLEGVGRPHFAAALIEHYNFTHPRMVFEKLLGRNRPAYIPRRLPEPSRAIEAIHDAGGIAVWAHPVRREANERAFLKRAARKLTNMGLDAIEGYYSMFSSVETAMVTEVAGSLDLALSGGSDFHGANSPDVILGFGAGGLRVPAALLDGLKAKRFPGLPGQVRRPDVYDN